MPLRKRRWRRPRRSRWRGRRRKFYWRRYHRPYRRWRRRHHRPRTASVRYYPSRRRKRISVRGWEPLGNVCPTTIASSEATPYIDLDKEDYDIFKDPQSGSHGKWEGSWGHHFFTFRSLLHRSRYYFNYWSGDWEGYDYVAFLGGYIWLPRMPYFSWIFYLDSSIQSNPKQDDPEKKYQSEKSWVHPGILLNRPGARLMFSTAQSAGRGFFRKQRVRPPAAWEGNYRIDVARDFLLFHWSWTTCNMTSSFYDFYCQRKRMHTHNDTCPQVPWFMGDQYWTRVKGTFSAATWAKPLDGLDDRIYSYKADSRSAWVLRKLYVKSDCVNTPSPDHAPSNFHNWGPFLPQNVILDSSTGQSIYFRYKLYFKVSGDTLYRRLPSTPCKGSVIPPAPGFKDGPCPEVQTRPILKKRTPPTIYEILPGDLDQGGLLPDRAYRRILGSCGTDKPTAMGSIPPEKGPQKKWVQIQKLVGSESESGPGRKKEFYWSDEGKPGGEGPLIPPPQ
uniref:Capsid protein n=1 Tax=Torque teno Leptonychotes weddellii virus-1 TaxID=2012676 RepID=A0A1Z2RVF8_9VIRU|nr:ORF1 [Torque teno Leptonychotes weddellii virus 1]